MSPSASVLVQSRLRSSSLRDQDLQPAFKRRPRGRASGQVEVNAGLGLTGLQQRTAHDGT